MHPIKFMPWWHEALSPSVKHHRELPKSTDIVIIGSGYTGLSAALTLSRAGRGVLLLEANEIGFGASTRNGGQIGSGNQKFTAQQLINLYGKDKARALLNTGTEMLGYIEGLLKSEDIDCHYRISGRFRGAVRPKHYEQMARDMEDLKRLAGVAFYMVTKAEQHNEVGTDYYYGGSVLPKDASLHPGLYHRGLLERAVSAGTTVIDKTPVTEIMRNKPGFRIRTTRGIVTSSDVIVATNAYTGNEFKKLKKRIVPIGSSIIATEELAQDELVDLMPTGRVYGNTARVFHYYRPSTDGRRLLFGGRMGRLGSQQSAYAFKHLRREMIRVFPQLHKTRITHCWSGHIAYTKDTLPHLGCHDGIWYATGYCGTGVSRSTWFGHKVALKVLGKPEGKTVFDDLSFRPFTCRWAAPFGVLMFETWYRIQDALFR